MSDNSYTEVTRQSWFGRLGGAVKGIFIGILLFIASFFLLIWNEHRAIDTTRGLEQAENELSTVSAAPLLAENEGKLVYFTASANPEKTLSDELFGISSEALVLRRQVEMYQWKEEVRSKTEKELGGGSKTVKTYHYNKTWSSQHIDSGRFKQSSEYQNPASMPYKSATQYAVVTAGDYRIPNSMLSQLASNSPLYPKDDIELADGFVRYGEGLYRGNPEAPKIGDIRVTFWQVEPGAISAIAQQVGNTLQPYTARSGTSVEILKAGTHSADQLFQQAHSENSTLSWILRAVGLAMMFIGLTAMLKPLSVLGDVVPLIGNIIGMGSALVAGLVTVVLGMLTIAIAWISVRPLLAIGLIAIAGAAVYLLFQRRSKVKAEQVAIAAQQAQTKS
ncbi:TMEM43 family protein [Parahaliea sp. F7430]|uniref:TMEM43 family protein n=1 Tax=Sediminihaliea albiluteola TaxID=2758564 RepID=A0A7W2TYK7_9GAMM|nr:TMEM43 family protein [Sediminihaliea albiluteola]MBA6414353.1 TMEM43 family protein [Sediminihaliea albiluteola]